MRFPVVALLTFFGPTAWLTETQVARIQAFEAAREPCLHHIKKLLEPADKAAAFKNLAKVFTLTNLCIRATGIGPPSRVCGAHAF